MSELNYAEEDEYKEEEDQPVGSGTGSPRIFTANIRASKWYQQATTLVVVRMWPAGIRVQ
jgi:hypothetical protein